MNTLLAYLTVLIAAAIPWLEVLLVVPAGILAGLPAIPVVLVAAIGNVATLVPLVYGGDRVRAWLRRRRGNGPDSGTRTDVRTAEAAHGEQQEGPAPAGSVGESREPQRSGRGARALQVFDRFGLIGLAIFGPLLTGVHVAALVALAAGAHRRPTALWLSGGVVVWSALAAAATVVGLETFVDPDRLPDLGLN